jgi:hypothetical protein
MSDLAELFKRDPLSMSKQDIEQIVEKLRASRMQFVLGDKTAGKTAAAKPKKAKASAVKPLTLDDLTIEF